MTKHTKTTSQGKGRPPVTRARVLTYWRKHGPCSIAQVERGTGASRRHVIRLLVAASKAGLISRGDFCHLPQALEMA
jgi:hypothetical protein